MRGAGGGSGVGAVAENPLAMIARPAKDLEDWREAIPSRPGVHARRGRKSKLSTMCRAVIIDVIESQENDDRFAAASATGRSGRIMCEHFSAQFAPVPVGETLPIRFVLGSVFSMAVIRGFNPTGATELASRASIRHGVESAERFDGLAFPAALHVSSQGLVGRIRPSPIAAASFGLSGCLAKPTEHTALKREQCGAFGLAARSADLTSGSCCHCPAGGASPPCRNCVLQLRQNQGGG